MEADQLQTTPKWTLRKSDKRRKLARMKVRAFSRQRKALLWILAGAIVANAAYFFLVMRPQVLEEPREQPKYVLEPLNQLGVLGGERPSVRLPTYDGISWSVEGKPVTRLRDFLIDTNHPDSPHSFGLIMPIELAGNGTSEDFRRTIEALAHEGICRVAVFDRSAPVAQQGLATAVRVRSYLDAGDIAHECIDRVQR